eukprot:m.34057 g.34057  ORF g.34057 m.34057 type:complete len:467 (-) comp16924_c0_seq2:85-1485(-)
MHSQWVCFVMALCAAPFVTGIRIPMEDAVEPVVTPAAATTVPSVVTAKIEDIKLETQAPKEDIVPEDFGSDFDGYVDMERGDWYDAEEQERIEMEQEYIEYFKSERKKMIEDPEYRDEIIEELEEDIFPEIGGYKKAGVQEQGLYDIATQLLRAELATGRGGVKTKLDRQHDKSCKCMLDTLPLFAPLYVPLPLSVAVSLCVLSVCVYSIFPVWCGCVCVCRAVNTRRRMAKRRRRDRENGIGPDLDLAPEEKLFKAREETIAKRRRASFLQREAASVMRQRKAIALETDLEKKNDLVTKHRQHMEDLKQRSANYPGHRKQLEQIWDKEDGMIGIRFDPKAFFRMHDITGDDMLDVKEIQAIMAPEARALHTIEEGYTDELAIAEEATIMAETMIEEHDKNNNGVVEYQEFLDYAETEGFIVSRDWHALDPEEELRKLLEKANGNKDLTDEDLEAFRKDPKQFITY